MGDDMGPRPGSRRADVRRTRVALIAGGARLLRTGRPLTMRAVADEAGVARSTLYRHFGSPAAVERAIRQEALAMARSGIARAASGRRPPLAELRSAVAALVEVGARLPLDMLSGPPPPELVDDAAEPLTGLAERLARAAGLVPPPAGACLRTALGHFLKACVAAGWSAPHDAETVVEQLMSELTEPLDEGLLLLDAEAIVIAVNAEAQSALDPAEPVEAGAQVSLRSGGLYEDGSPATPEAHPLLAALASGEAQTAIRGQHDRDGDPRWLAIDVRPLRRREGRPYGFVAVFTDVSDQRWFERRHLRPPGELAASTAPLLDVVRVLDEIPAPLLPEQLVAEASRLAGGPAALYVLDIDGSHLLRLAGREDFPARLMAPLAIGPELAPDGLPDLKAHLAQELPGVVMAPMWLRGRALGVLLALRGSESGLREVARIGAAAMELGSG
jgi:AcrR family transcriptional regulator